MGEEVEVGVDGRGGSGGETHLSWCRRLKETQCQRLIVSHRPTGNVPPTDGETPCQN